VAKSFARIHRRNLLAQGIVPLTFADESDYDKAKVEQCWEFPNIREELEQGSDTITVRIDDGDEIQLKHDFSEHEREILVAGGLLRYLREQGPAESQNGGGKAQAGEDRAAQEDAGERADGSEDGDSGVARGAQGVGGQHE
jgi:aconitate hydratase